MMTLRWKTTLALSVMLAMPGVGAQSLSPDLQQLRDLMGQAALHPSQLELLRAEAQRLQTCFAQLDPKAMEKLQAQARQMGDEVRAMCTDGLREDAQNLALTHARTLVNSSEIQKLQDCGSSLSALVDALPFLAATQAKDLNVCDLDF